MFCNTGYNSTNLVTSITIRNPNVTSYSGMFYDVATESGSQFTVNYTSETSDLVDQMIATKSTNSNVVSISFTDAFFIASSNSPYFCSASAAHLASFSKYIA